MKTGLSYDDVYMVPQYNNIHSRQVPKLGTLLTTGCSINIPLVAANMDTIIGEDMARVMVKNGTVPIFHRFYRELTDLAEVAKKFPGQHFLSWGTGSIEPLQQLVDLYSLEPIGVCIDIAHGHSKQMIKTIEAIRLWQPGYNIIAGNVCTGMAFHDLAHAGADAVKVGIGPGSVCTTRKVTAFGRAQFSAVMECAEVSQALKVPLIADGGIRSSRELVLALAAGASSVMIGGMFARTMEAAGRGKFRGQASAEFQQDYYGGLKEGTVAEGIATEGPVQGTAQEVIDKLLGGLRSGMTYAGAADIAELQRKAKFERTTRNYYA